MNFREQIELAKRLKSSIKPEMELPHVDMARVGVLVGAIWGNPTAVDIQTVMDVRIRELELLEQIEQTLEEVRKWQQGNR